VKKTLILVALSLACSGSLWARAPRQAMVLKVQGKHVFHSKEVYSEQASTGQMWTAGDELELKEGASITLLELSKGRQLEITGPGTVRVTPGGLEVSRASTRELSKVAHKLTLTGENHRQIGGKTVRNAGSAATSELHLNYEMLKIDGGQLVLRVPRPFPREELRFEFYEGYQPWTLLDDGTVLKPDQEFAPRPVEEVLARASATAGDLLWKVPLPKSPTGKPWGIMVRDRSEENSPVLLYTRVAELSTSESKEIGELKQETQAWAAREPQNAAPWLVYATFLEEKSQLREAAAAADRALKLRPKDKGLLQLKARLLADMGDYQGASRVLGSQP
jgi:hypothetical protein